MIRKEVLDLAFALSVAQDERDYLESLVDPLRDNIVQLLPRWEQARMDEEVLRESIHQLRLRAGALLIASGIPQAEAIELVTSWGGPVPPF